MIVILRYGGSFMALGLPLSKQEKGLAVERQSRFFLRVTLALLFKLSTSPL